MFSVHACIHEQGHPLDSVKGGDGLWSDDDDDVAYYKEQVGEAPEAGTFRHSKKPRFDKGKVCVCMRVRVV